MRFILSLVGATNANVLRSVLSLFRPQVISAMKKENFYHHSRADAAFAKPVDGI